MREAEIDKSSSPLRSISNVNKKRHKSSYLFFYTQYLCAEDTFIYIFHFGNIGNALQSGMRRKPGRSLLIKN